MLIYLGSKDIKSKLGEEMEGTESHVVDRNFVVAAMAKYLTDTHGDDAALECRYETNLQYVDSSNHRVLVRSKATGQEEYLAYDLLVGADGSRSVVHEALVKENYDFEMDFGDIFNDFRAVYVKRPATLAPNSFALLPNCFLHMNGISLPMPDGMVNITIGCTRNNFKDLPKEFKSDDPKTVASFVRKNLKCFELDDYDDLPKSGLAMGAGTAQHKCIATCITAPRQKLSSWVMPPTPRVRRLAWE